MLRRIAVTGGRDHRDAKLVYSVLNRELVTNGPFELIVGCAKGVDAFARRWAKAKGIPMRVFYAKWQKYDERAGMIRNTEMLLSGRPQHLYAFPGNVGTANMINQAQTAEISIDRVYHDGQVRRLPARQMKTSSRLSAT